MTACVNVMKLISDFNDSYTSGVLRINGLCIDVKSYFKGLEIKSYLQANTDNLNLRNVYIDDIPTVEETTDDYSHIYNTISAALKDPEPLKPFRNLKEIFREKEDKMKNNLIQHKIAKLAQLEVEEEAKAAQDATRLARLQAENAAKEAARAAAEEEAARLEAEQAAIIQAEEAAKEAARAAAEAEQAAIIQAEEAAKEAARAAAEAEQAAIIQAEEAAKEAARAAAEEEAAQKAQEAEEAARKAEEASKKAAEEEAAQKAQLEEAARRERLEAEERQQTEKLKEELQTAINEANDEMLRRKAVLNPSILINLKSKISEASPYSVLSEDITIANGVVREWENYKIKYIQKTIKDNIINLSEMKQTLRNNVITDRIYMMMYEPKKFKDTIVNNENNPDLDAVAKEFSIAVLASSTKLSYLKSQYNKLYEDTNTLHKKLNAADTIGLDWATFDKKYDFYQTSKNLSNVHKYIKSVFYWQAIIILDLCVDGMDGNMLPKIQSLQKFQQLTTQNYVDNRTGTWVTHSNHERIKKSWLLQLNKEDARILMNKVQDVRNTMLNKQNTLGVTDAERAEIAQEKKQRRIAVLKEVWKFSTRDETFKRPNIHEFLIRGNNESHLTAPQGPRWTMTGKTDQQKFSEFFREFKDTAELPF